MEELGRGAFGKVHKGILKEMPKVEVFFKPREERVEVHEGRVVAIKVLLGKQTESILCKLYTENDILRTSTRARSEEHISTTCFCMTYSISFQYEI